VAWRNLVHDKRRFAVSLAGVTFAVVLMFVQFGFRNALLDSTVGLIERMDGDLFLVSRRFYTLAVPEPFSRRRLFESLSVRGTDTVHPVYVTMGSWRNPVDGQRRSIRTVGVDPESGILDVAELDRKAAELQAGDQILFDLRSKKKSYGFDPSAAVFISGRRVLVAGTFQLGSDFGAEGNIIVSDKMFASLFRSRPGEPGRLSFVDLGVVRLARGTDIDVCATEMQSAVGSDMLVLTKSQLIEQETRFWKTNTPIGFTFTLSMIVGFVVGVVICYQILSSDVSDRLPEYATLKALGYNNRYIVGVVMSQAVFLGMVGFVPGLAASAALFLLMGEVTGLPMKLTVLRCVIVLGLTVGMCMVSGIIALRKVRNADPAEVFG
jgi:putative ABC transport system permease protein